MTKTYSLYWNMSRHYNVPMACEHIADYYAHKLGVTSRKGSTYMINNR